MSIYPEVTLESTAINKRKGTIVKSQLVFKDKDNLECSIFADNLTKPIVTKIYVDTNLNEAFISEKLSAMDKLVIVSTFGSSEPEKTLFRLLYKLVSEALEKTSDSTEQQSLYSYWKKYLKNKTLYTCKVYYLYYN